MSAPPRLASVDILDTALKAAHRREHAVPTFQRADALMSAPPPVEIIEGVAWAGAITVLVSESGTGKTLVLLSASAAISDNVPWCGRRVRSGSVAYVSFEGDALGLRLRALKTIGHRLSRVYVLRASDPLSPIVDRDRGELPSKGELDLADALDALSADLAARGEPPIVLIVVDTVRASLAGSEDSSESVSAYLRTVRRLLAHVPGAAGVLAHHSGWQDGETKKKRERGSSAFRGNTDGVLYLELGEADPDTPQHTPLVLRALKVRDSEKPLPLALVRRVVELGESRTPGDVRDGPLTSCVIERDTRSRADREAAATAKAAAAQEADTLAVLRIVAKGDIHSLSALRDVSGLRQNVVVAAVARAAQAGWLQPPAKQRLPYTLTVEGRERLAESPAVSTSSSL